MDLFFDLFVEGVFELFFEWSFLKFKNFLKGLFYKNKLLAVLMGLFIGFVLLILSCLAFLTIGITLAFIYIKVLGHTL